MDCLFCKIAAGEIPAKEVYQDENVFAFEDIDKKAPVHILVVPKKHISSIIELDDAALAKALIDAIKTIVRQQGIEDTGFRVVVNTGDDGGQTVHHLHFHILGGRSMQWPPG